MIHRQLSRTRGITHGRNRGEKKSGEWARTAPEDRPARPSVEHASQRSQQRGRGRKKTERVALAELVPSSTHSQRCTGAGRGEGRGRLGCGIVCMCVFGWNVTAQSVLSAERYRTCGSEVQVSVWGGVGGVESQTAVHSCGSREARAVRGRDGRWQGKVRRVIHCQKAREQGDKVGCVPRGNIASSAILDVAQVPGFASLGIDCTRFRGSDEGA